MARELPSEAAIRALTTPEVYERGRSYQRAGAVSGLVARGAEISAAVEGSEAEPYRVTLRIADGAVAETRCTCPYEWGGACKHVVAALLALRAKPGALAERPPLREILEPFGRDALADLILRRAVADSDFAGWIEADLATTVDPDAGRRPIDTAPVAERTRALLASPYRRDDYWDGYRTRGNAEALRALVEKAVPFLQVGDGRNALRVLEAVAGPFVESWTAYGYVDDETDYLLFDDLAALMAEAALTSDLTEAERTDLAETLRAWDDAIGEAFEPVFPVAVRALETGWDEPELDAVLAGAPGPWPPEDADLEDLRLTAVRLRVLDGCGRHDAYLNLARAAGAHTRVAAMLVRLGRVGEAVAYAGPTFTKPAESLDLAQTLAAAGRRKEAVAVADAGLTLGQGQSRDDADWHRGGSPVPLARWLRETATGTCALRAARVAFARTLSRDDFDAVRKPAGRDWPSVRAELLAELVAAERAPDRPEILLREGLIDEAVASVRDGPAHTVRDDVLLALMDAAHARHPDWVIGLAERRAARIMDEGATGSYAQAAEWLRRAALAYEADGRIDAWSARIEGLIETHKRKYKLRPLLEDLRFGG
ncbi:SWIM zinc finger family protein [Methylobacterium sp. NEAU 140]|uniref:SWIM zinc finger family protein n=1 Tax=Methylobacterium sp. NEAU 140 TaxID=3064945 RepID=UPI0027329838|nr:SWIM zinc finger family protein [Methylobacterium sp. NEAU 140]MDP4023278.1 SWIM zinc finger family protein [Methylobacterium sp. NEAU 140]